FQCRYHLYIHLNRFIRLIHPMYSPKTVCCTLQYAPQSKGKQIIQVAQKYHATIVQQNQKKITVRIPKNQSTEQAIRYFDSIQGVQKIYLEEAYVIR
ncbi:MAG: hypothetical protein IJR44_00025, partial [Neisseriaceae bacterium]|nr:hypothetical protein [Neisseriaceae bacterium]